MYAEYRQSRTVKLCTELRTHGHQGTISYRDQGTILYGEQGTISLALLIKSSYTRLCILRSIVILNSDHKYRETVTTIRRQRDIVTGVS